MAKKKQPDGNVVARNRKARHNYFIEENIEAGLILVGTEVKSLRSGRASIEEAYAAEQDGELFLINAYIPEYQAGRQERGGQTGATFDHDGQQVAKDRPPAKIVRTNPAVFFFAEIDDAAIGLDGRPVR